MRNRPIKAWRNPLLCAVLFFSLASFTLETDKDQDVIWKADDARMTIEDEVRIWKLTNNVKVTQGSIEIEGSQAIFEYSVATGELQKVTFNGNPVHYQQLLGTSEGMVIGTSEIMLFYTDTLDGETVLELIGDANIQSPDSTMSCVAITYLADRDLIRETTGPCEGVLSTPNN